MSTDGDGAAPATGPARPGAAARALLLSTYLAAAVCLTWLLHGHSLQPSASLVLLALCAGTLGGHVVRISERVHMSPSLPFQFAALLLWGPIEAFAVALAIALGAGLRRQMPLYQVAFNASAIGLCGTAAWVCYAPLRPAGAPLLDHTLAILIASLAFHTVNTVLVGAMISLTGRGGFVGSVRSHLTWMAPPTVAGAAIGLMTALLVERLGTSGFLLTLPLVGLVYFTYRLHAGRLEEKQRRLQEVERLNAELESKVHERTQELLQLNDDLASSNRGLEEAARIKSEFLATVSHELRTPLNAIIGFSELLRDDPDDPMSAGQSDFVDEIHGAGKNLLALINDILDLSKIEAGRMKVHLEDVDPVASVEEAVATVWVLAANKGIEIERRMPDDIEMIRADPAKLRQVLWNLLSNAVKFTDDDGHITIEVSGDGDWLRLRVEDDGIGIPAADQPHIFEQFYQVDGSHSRRYAGTGLGLALVRELVELHGGRVELDSEVGRGSCFLVQLPVGGPEAAAATAAVPALAEVGG